MENKSHRKDKNRGRRMNPRIVLTSHHAQHPTACEIKAADASRELEGTGRRSLLVGVVHDEPAS
jgi:hypothetical protein